MMKTSDDIIDGFDGLLTKEQADKLYLESRSQIGAKKGKFVNVKYINDIMSPGATGILKGLEKERLNLEDKIYRIFNPSKRHFGNSTSVSRILVLGSEGTTATVLLGKKLSDEIDSGLFFRGDTVMITNLTMDIRASLLRPTRKTSIKKVAAEDKCIKDFSLLNPGMKNIDIAGVAIEAGPTITHGNPMPKKFMSTYIVLSDGKTSVHVACTGSSAEMVSKLPLNSKVKIEFCNVRESIGKIEVRANDLSRIAVLK